MKVIIDTNIIVSDFLMRSPSFEILLENCKAGRIQVYVPEVVKNETLSNFRFILKSIKDKTDKEINVLRKITGKDCNSLLTEVQINEEVNKYNEHLIQLFNDNNVLVLPYPQVPHEKIALRAIAKRKPFKSNGSGYRDNLIWENIKELLTQSLDLLIPPEFIFITNNIKDFGTDPNTLHPDLINDLINDSLNPSSITLFLNLQEYIDKVLKVHMEQEQRLELSLRNNELTDFDLKSITLKFLSENLIGNELDNEEIDIPYEFENPTVQSINEDYIIKDVSVKRLSTTKILIDVQFDLEVHLDFFIYKMDYWGINDDIRPSIIDYDWNEHYMWAEKDWTFNIIISILLSTEMEILSCEINRISSKYSAV